MRRSRELVTSWSWPSASLIAQEVKTKVEHPVSASALTSQHPPVGCTPPSLEQVPSLKSPPKVKSMPITLPQNPIGSGSSGRSLPLLGGSQSGAAKGTFLIFYSSREHDFKSTEASSGAGWTASDQARV